MLIDLMIDFQGLVGAPACGDVMKLQIKVRGMEGGHFSEVLVHHS